jgi:hypothetical protein
MFNRLRDQNHHVAYFFLKHYFAIPKLTFLLRTTPIWMFPDLINLLDNLIHSTLLDITNVNIDKGKWILASLPLRFGGIGVRRVEDICIPSFMASIIGHSDLICALIPIIQIDLSDISYYEETLAAWNTICPNVPADPSSQKQWDSLNVSRILSTLSF